MKATLRVLSALLSYPTPELQAAVGELRQALERERIVPARLRSGLDRLLGAIATEDIYALQERYVGLFDRTRSLSLHLFEHVHGESRDRGQAMVDLGLLYEQHGVAIAKSELPDYLPVFLEFLSLVPPAEARDLIGETAHVLEAMRQRLVKRESDYSDIFACLAALADARPAADLTERIMREPDDDPDDLAALDKAWMDAEVTFGPAAGSCGTDMVAAKVRSGVRPAPGVEVPRARRPIVSTNGQAGN